MLFRQIVDDRLSQYAYLIGCQRTKEAIVIDPERDVDRYIEAAEAEGLTVTAVTETHIHADFLSGTRELADRTGAKVFLSREGGPDWQYEWPTGYPHRLLSNGDSFRVGNIELKALHTPGHTPEHMVFLVIDHGSQVDEPMGMVSGDFLFVGDVGRPDLLESAAGVAGAMKPSAQALFRSVRGVLDLPDFLQVWPGHGAGSACGKALGAVPTTTLGYEKRFNPAIRAVGRGEAAFVEEILEGQPEPPPYFARMKRENRVGPAPLGRLPTPRSLTLKDLAHLHSKRDVYLIDTRLDRQAFADGHLPGSLYAPLDRSFPTVVGSYAEPGAPIHLIIEPARVEEAVRALVRIGLDQVEGVASPALLAEHAAQNGAMTRTPVASFVDVDRLAREPGTIVLDVRGKAEHDAGHVPNAINIAHTRLLPRLGELPKKKKTLLVHCAVGARAAVAAAFLQREGFTVVHVNDAFASYPAPVV
jgi:hydroxyacylglutathione hydrolase